MIPSTKRASQSWSTMMSRKLLHAASAAAFAMLMQSSALAEQGEANPERATSAKDASSDRMMLVEGGGAPAEKLKEYFAAIEASDWRAMIAMTADPDTREMMKQDEQDGLHLKMLKGMREKSPTNVEFIEGWIEHGVCSVRYRGLGVDRRTSGLAELILDNGEWKIAVMGLKP